MQMRGCEKSTHPGIAALAIPLFACGGKTSPQPSPLERE